MPELDQARFPEFFEGVTGHEPFEWQAVLVDWLLDGHTPEVLDVPTGFGKTSLIACWAYALAAGASVPRRLCVVVDRRLVVDASYDDARALEGALGDALENDGQGAPAREVADRLRALHGDGDLPPLRAVRMRGGVTWDSRWLERPDQAAVVVGTVDQFGSRLLMRGYGVSERMRPINAALVGLGSWLVIDEAHIAEPLVRTASAVARYQQATPDLGDAGPLRVTQMSATAIAGEAEVLHADLDAQGASTRFPRAAQAARQRTEAHKPTALVDVTDLAGANRAHRRSASAKLGGALADLARTLDDDARIVGVIANTIGAARLAHQRLADAGEEACLLIGRAREYERDRVVEDWVERVRVGAPRPPEGERVFVVATQTVEVGANLDFDAIVTECAPLPALIQRFGRVNRVGERFPRRCAIVHAGFAHGEDGLVYGEATGRTWEYLCAQAGAEVVEVTTRALRTPVAWSGQAPLNLGLRGAQQLRDEAPPDVAPASEFVPRLLGAHLERWAATSPAPMPDQPVAPFLHGIERPMPDVDVAWRADPSHGGDDPQAWAAWLDLVRPVEWEFVSVPVWEVRALLAGDEGGLAEGDLEGMAPDQEEAFAQAEAEGLLGMVYPGGTGTPRPVWRPQDVEVGDRAVLRAHLGGHDRWGWTGRRRDEHEALVPDVADLAPSRRRERMRLTAEVVETFVSPGQREAVRSAFEPLDELLRPWLHAEEPEPPVPETRREVLDEALDRLRTLDVPKGAPPLRVRLKELRDRNQWHTEVLTLPGRHAEVEPWRLPGFLVRRSAMRRLALDAVADDDVLGTSAGSSGQGLGEHGEQVGALAASFARNLALSEDLQRAVSLAGCWHDLGKAEPRFQLSLHDGDELAAASAREPLAKSGRDPRDPVALRARAIAGLPRRFRHEALSARLVAALAVDAGLPDGFDQALVHHLVASHHGYARPLFPSSYDPEAPKVETTIDGRRIVVDGGDQVDWTQPGRFEALNATYGWWGLALLETLVRLADMRVSEVH